MGRRKFLTAAAAGAGAVGAIALVPALGRERDGAAELAAEQPHDAGPVMVYVRDAAAGEVAILTGSSERTVTDPGLVTQLLRAQRRHLA